MKIRALAFLLLIFFCCCHKTKKNSNGNNSNTFTYTTTYDSVITTYANTSKLFTFQVNVLTGSITDSPLTYSIGGVPTGVTVNPATVEVTALLGGNYNIVVGNVPVGDYKLTFVSSTAKGVSKNYNLKLRVIGLPDYALKLEGTYPGSYDFCIPENMFYNHTSVVSSVSGTPYQIKISNVKSMGAGVYVTANVSTVVTVPFQTVGAYKIWGTGTFTHDNPPYDTGYQMTIYDTMVNGVDTQHCTMHVQH